MKEPVKRVAGGVLFLACGHTRKASDWAPNAAPKAGWHARCLECEKAEAAKDDYMTEGDHQSWGRLGAR